MIKTTASAVAIVVLGVCLAGCNPSTPPAADAPPPTGGTTAGTTTAAGSLSDPKGSIAYQLDLLKAGDTEKLKECFTDRVRGDVTQEVVDKGKADAGKATIDEVYASEEKGEDGGKKTVKVKMKNGRTLTTLIETDGKWLADTVWFK